MLRKQIAIISVILLCTVIIIAFLYLKNVQRFNDNDPVYAVPKNAAVVLQINKTPELLKALNNQTGFVKDLMVFQSFHTLQKIIHKIDTIDILKTSAGKNLINRPFTLSFHPSTDHSFDWMINQAIQSRQDLNDLKRLLSGFDGNTETYKAHGANFSRINRTLSIHVPLYISHHHGVLTITNSGKLMDSSLEQRQKEESLLEDPGFNRIQKTSFTSNVTTGYFNYQQLPDFTSGLFNAPFLGTISDWTEVDISIRNDAIYLNGFTYDNDNLSFTNIFRGIEPQKSTIAHVLPATTKFLTSYTFSSKNRFKENLIQYIEGLQNSDASNAAFSSFHSRHHHKYEDLFFSFLDKECALAITDFEGNKKYDAFLVFNTTGQTETLEIINNVMTKSGQNPQKIHWAILDDQTRFPVYITPESETMETLWAPLFPMIPARYFAFYRNYLVFGNSVESIEKFMYANILNKTLSAHPYYTPFTESFSYQENFFMFAEIPHIFHLTQNHLNRDVFNPTNLQNQTLENFYGIGLQMSSAGDLIYTTLHANYTPHRDKEPRTIWQSRIDSTIIGKPVLVDNHNTGEKEILVQDALYNLYLINYMGRVLWKRPLDGPILNEIVQIDYYKNNKLQYLFNTANRLYLLDRNGNHVARYPIALPAKATNGLAVFDYDNNNEYRIFVALENRQVVLYDKTGNINPGWNRLHTEGIVSAPLQHFRNQGRDYIVFSDQYRNYILDRRGANRTTPSSNFFRNSSSSFYLEGENSSNAALVTSTQSGELARIRLPGGDTNIRSLFDNPGNHHFTLLMGSSHNPQYLFTTENQIIRFNREGNKTLNIEFENKIHPLTDIYRFSATDIKYGVVEKSGGQIHLINSDGSRYQGFPLSGISRFSIGFLHSSAYRFNLITGGPYNYLYNYRVE